MAHLSSGEYIGIEHLGPPGEGCHVERLLKIDVGVQDV